MTDRIDDVFRYMEQAEALRKMLAELEWAGRVRGQGYGPMGYGGDGPSIPACPMCGGIHPERGRAEFVAESLGHRPDCRLVLAIRGEP